MLTKLVFALILLTNLFISTSYAESSKVGAWKRVEEAQLVSLVFVGSKSGLSESSFGHIALRFSSGESLGLLDQVVQFVADVSEDDNKFQKYLKGSGIAGNYTYRVKTEVDSFYNYKEVKTKSEDREVTVYPLKLTDSERKDLINYVINFSQKDGGPRYRFFNKNCSFFAADALEQATDRDFKVKSHPWRLADELSRQGLMQGREQYFPSLSIDRGNAISQALASSISEHLQTFGSLESFKESFFSEDFYLKINSYFKLLAVAFHDSVNANEEEKRFALGLYRYLMSLENLGTRNTLKRFLNNTNNDSFLFLSKRINQSIQPLNGEAVKHEAVMYRGFPSIRLEWTENNDGKKELHIPLSGLGYNPNNFSIVHQGNKVASMIYSKNKNWLELNNMSYSLEFDKKKAQFNVIVHIDQKAVQAKRDFADFEKLSVLALNNIFDFGQGFGSCYAMVKVQKALNDRLTFLPELSANNDFDKLELIKKVYLGDYAVVAGYSNINEFTASIDREKFKSLIEQVQEDLHKSSASTLWKNIRRRQDINKKGVLQLKSIVEAGHTPEMIIALKKPGAFRYEKAGHVVLVLGMKENRSLGGWDLEIYDPNFGLTKEMRIDKDFKIQYSMFRKDFEYTGVIDEIIPEKVSIDLGIRSLKLSPIRLKSFVREVSGRSFRAHQLL